MLVWLWKTSVPVGISTGVAAIHVTRLRPTMKACRRMLASERERSFREASAEISKFKCTGDRKIADEGLLGSKERKLFGFPARQN
jgi:hypothetical protein